MTQPRPEPLIPRSIHCPFQFFQDKLGLFGLTINNPFLLPSFLVWQTHPEVTPAPSDILPPGGHTFVCFPSPCVAGRTCDLLLSSSIRQRWWGVTPVIILHYIKSHVSRVEQEILCWLEETSSHVEGTHMTRNFGCPVGSADSFQLMAMKSQGLLSYKEINFANNLT